MKKIIFLMILAAVLAVVSCGKSEGEFAFKLPEDKGYKKMNTLPEFDSSTPVNWIYTFSSNRGLVNYGVIILKKELIWVDILSYADYTDSEKKSIYGVLKGLDPGDYRLVITEIDDTDQKVVDEIGFYIFSDEDIY